MDDPMTPLREGMRVVVRHRLEPAAGAPGGPRFSDVVGELKNLGQDAVIVQTRRGTVHVRRAGIVAAKEVPPRPVRPGAPHLAISMADLQRVMVDSWPPIERKPLGEWLLRASGGFTNRGNSVLPIGQPGRPLAEAVDTVERWYAARRLRANVELSGREGFAVEEDPLGRELVGRGYRPRSSTCVLTAATAVIAGHGGQGGHGEQVRISPTLDDEWFAAYCGTRSVPEGPAKAVLTGSPQQWFVSVVGPERVVAIARMAVAHQWSGIAAVWVDPTLRRRGLARELTAAAARLAQAHGIRSMHLQTELDNTAARALYQGMGFSTHHEYVYVSEV